MKGCNRPVKALGLCAAHYDRARNGKNMADPVRVVSRDPDDLARLKSKVKIDEATGCWVWQASLNTNGYGQFAFKGRPRPAHRVSWELHNGPIPEGENAYKTANVLHRCDNPLCVNPDHLFLGDQSDNANDAVSKERWGKRGLTGEAHGRAVVTEEIVRAIRASDLSVYKLGEQYGLSAGAVQHIRKRRSRQHVE